MSGPSYEVTQVYEGYRIRESTQPEGEGMLVTHDWLKVVGLGPPTRSNIQDIINAALYNHEGGTLVAPNLNEVYASAGLSRRFPKNFAVNGLATARSGLIIARH